MRWCARCRRRLYDESAAFCPFDGTRLELPSDEGSRSDPHLGTTLQGQFHLLAAIGSGAMGTVYRAWQSGMERQVAVKVLRADLVSDREMRRRFLREGRTAARLDHPNIVSVHMVGETDAGVPYLVMEHLGGETLEQVLDREARLPAERAAEVARQIASGLAEAHAAGVVHRDLKPGNVVLLQRRGTGELIKIFDFGIAKLADRALVAGDASRLTRDGAIFGTPHYIAPEQAQGAAVDGRADLYSLGVLLYRMLSGRLPFEGNAVAVILAHIGREPPPLSTVAPDLRPELAAVVMRCLAKDADHRFASAEDFIEALDRATSPHPRATPRAATPALERDPAPDPPWTSARLPALSSTPMQQRSPTASPALASRPGTTAPPRAATTAIATAAPSRSARRGSDPALAHAVGPSVRRGSDAAFEAAPSRWARRGSDPAVAHAASPSVRRGSDAAFAAESAPSLRRGLAPVHGGLPPHRGARVVEAIGCVADQARAAGRGALEDGSGGSWEQASPSRTWLRPATAALRPGRSPARRGLRAGLASLAVVVICTGAGTGTAALLRRVELGTTAGAEELAAVAEPAPAAAHLSLARGSAPARRAVMVSEHGYAVRALLPEPITADRPVELLFDLWDPAGQPLAVPAVPVVLTSIASDGGATAARAGDDDVDGALAARPVPEMVGRYRLLARFPRAGEAAALLELADGSSIHLHFDIAP